jgi:hypothetical protein
VKRSERLIRGTIVALAVLTVGYVAAVRLQAAARPEGTPVRTSSADLAALRDFKGLQLNGDFSVEIVQGAEYSVTFAPAAESRGDLHAAMRGQTLELRGYGNTRESRVRIAMPGIERLDAENIPELTVSGFRAEAVAVQTEGVGQVTLRNNAVREWRVVGAGTKGAVVQVDRATLDGAAKVDVVGRVALAPIE